MKPIWVQSRKRSVGKEMILLFSSSQWNLMTLQLQSEMKVLVVIGGRISEMGASKDLWVCVWVFVGVGLGLGLGVCGVECTMV